MQHCFGDSFRFRFIATNPRVGRKIFQHAFANLGGRQFKVYELVPFALQKASTTPFEERTDDEIDKGLEYITENGPRSASDMQQLRVANKGRQEPTVPIFGWPAVLIEKALRLISSEGRLARKEAKWPIPLTQK